MALLTGENDFNRGEVERLRGPLLKDMGVRTRWWEQPGLGHAMPNEKLLGEAVKWLEDDVEHRRKLARRTTRRFTLPGDTWHEHRDRRPRRRIVRRARNGWKRRRRCTTA